MTNKKGAPLEWSGRPGTPSKQQAHNTTNAPSLQVPWCVKDLAPTPKKTFTAYDEEVTDYE